MILFTPNTLIKSAEVNANLAGLDTRIETLEDTPYASGQIGSSTSVAYKTLTEVINNGITKTNTTTYTVVTAGIYFMQFQQLVEPTATAPYHMIRINGTTKSQGWLLGSHMGDMNVSYMAYLNTGDTIRLYQSVAVSNTWTGEHSMYQIFRLTA